MSTSATPEIVRKTDTAPGQLETQIPASTMRSMQNPIALSGQVSSPKGIAIRLSTAIGMIHEADKWRPEQICDQPVMRHAMEVIEGERCDGDARDERG